MCLVPSEAAMLTWPKLAKSATETTGPNSGEFGY